MPKTIKVNEIGNPQLRIGMKKGGGMRFLHVGKGNPEAIKGQQNKLASCAKSASGLKGKAFKDKVKSCAKR